ncbi:MAG: biopolymer transporter ExbD [Pseudomonadota bacterium]
MSMSRRARRMDRQHKRGRSTALNLVSLMDIFTILVFFLLVNSTESETLERNKAVDIPESISQQKPRETVVVTVTPTQVLVQGEAVASVEDVRQADGATVPALRDALKQQVDRLIVKAGEDDLSAREVTIMGDRNIPYRVLKKVMNTCTEADYGQISLAVIQKGASLDEGGAS